MNTLNLVRRILVASALLVYFSQVTHASAEELSEESEMSVVLTQTMEEGNDVEEEASLKVSTQSMDKIKDNIINNYYENTNDGMNDYAQEIINEMTTNEKDILIDELENKVDLTQEEHLLLDTAKKDKEESRLMIILGSVLLLVGVGSYLVMI